MRLAAGRKWTYLRKPEAEAKAEVVEIDEILEKEGKKKKKKKV